VFEEAGCEVRIARLPAGADPDSVIKEEGAAAFQRLLDSAEPLMEYHLGALARRHDLSTAEGRLALVREAAQVVGQLRKMDSLQVVRVVDLLGCLRHLRRNV